MSSFPAWTDAAKARLTDLWATGEPVRRIAETMDLTRNAVIGMAHRMALPPRPSPIIRPPEGPALDLVQSMAKAGHPQAEITRCTGVSEYFVRRAVLQARAAAPLTVARVKPTPIPRSVSACACCWPIGIPHTPSFRFCDAQAARGRPYCQAHSEVAYVRQRGDHRDDAA